MKTVTLSASFRALAAAGLAVQLAACVSTEREVKSSNADPRATYRPPAAGDRSRLNSKTVLNTVSTSHVFSDPQKQDNFILQLRGPRILSSQAHFIVTSSTGDTLSHQVMPARALLGANAQVDSQASTVRDQEIAILQRMNSFFAVGHFSQPAVPANAEQPAEMDTNTWSALRDDPSAIGFEYQSAEGAEQRLAFVRKLGKAVVINQ